MSWTRRLADRPILLMLTLIVGLRLFAAACIPLTEDEAYYRLWAQHLQFGYYDHPPMIAWWIRAGTALLGDTALGLRLAAVVASGVCTWLIIDLTRLLGGDKPTALRAGLWYNATLTMGLGGILSTPDAADTLFWVATLWSLAKAQTTGRPLWWLIAGLTAGLAALSKYSALFLAPGVLLWLLATPAGRARLKTPWPWAAAFIALLTFTPNIAWNADHGWMSFHKQFGRVAPKGLAPAHLIELLVTQFLLLNPIIAVFAINGLWRRLKRGGAPALRADLALPLAASLPFAAYLALHSLHDRVEGHWPAPLFPALVICAAVAASEWDDGRTLRRLRQAAPILGFSASALVLAHMALPQTDVFGPRDPVLQLHGWPAFARQIDALRQDQGAAWVGTQSYGVAAQLTAAAPGPAPVFQLEERVRYALFPMTHPDLRKPGLAVDLDRRLSVAGLSRCFAEVRALGRIGRGADRGPQTPYAVFRVAGPKIDVWQSGCDSPLLTLPSTPQPAQKAVP